MTAFNREQHPKIFIFTTCFTLDHVFCTNECKLNQGHERLHKIRHFRLSSFCLSMGKCSRQRVCTKNTIKSNVT
jgi:hypothetical protein